VPGQEPGYAHSCGGVHREVPHFDTYCSSMPIPVVAECGFENAVGRGPHNPKRQRGTFKMDRKLLPRLRFGLRLSEMRDFKTHALGYEEPELRSKVGLAMLRPLRHPRHKLEVKGG